MRKVFYIVLVKIVPVIFFIVLGLFLAEQFSSSKPRIQTKMQLSRGTLVTVQKFQLSNEQIIVESSGTVIPAQKLTVTPELSGKLISLNPRVVPGGLIKKGEIIGQIEKSYYETIVLQRKAQLAEAKYNLSIEEGRQEIARMEWELLDAETKKKANKELLLRIPHIQRLKASLRYAERMLEQAELDLARTDIIAPFNAIVLEKLVEIEQLVTQQTRLATLVGIDYFYVQVHIPVKSLNYINLPDKNGKDGATVRVVQKITERINNIFIGKIVRVQGELEQVGRLVSLLVEIQNPFHSSQNEIQTSKTLSSSGETTKEHNDNSLHNDNIPLFLNSFVSVEIEGVTLENIFAIPQDYIREGNLIWIMDSNNNLEFRKIQIEWFREKDVLVTRGLSSDERVVTSRISKPVAGVALRTMINNNEGNNEFGQKRKQQ